MKLLKGEKNDLEVSILYFIPPGARNEVWHVEVKNKDGELEPNLNLINSTHHLDQKSLYPSYPGSGCFKNSKYLII